ncbi:MAG: ABC transporter ATP-binding protein [Candidatus Aminicenantes bacterium]|nr:ABC transporter ATP-binding protein [Candidatus Aminicenantes bacterium]
MCLLKVKNLSVESRTGDKKNPLRLLKQVNLTVKKNKITALIGESGAGKTMFARAVSALLPEKVYITSGNFFYEGKEVDFNWLKKFRAKEIFYSPQNAAASLNPVIRIKKQINEVSKISGPSLIETLKFLNIAEPLKLLNAYPFELSEGENQRALLAMAIAIKPRLLILDEPASSLDGDSRLDFMELIKNLPQRYAVSILLITHNLSIVRHIADNIYVILQGEIVESGEPAAIFRNPSHAYTKEIVELLLSCAN